MKKILLFTVIVFLSFSCGPSAEEINSEWFYYYRKTDSSIMEKLSEIMKGHGGYKEKEFCTNEDQLNYESRNGYKRDGSPGTNFTPQYWTKVLLYPYGRGKLSKGVKQNPFLPLQYIHNYDIVWYLHLSPSPMTMDKTWKPIEHNDEYLFYKWEERRMREPLSYITENFTQEEKMELFNVIDSVKNNFMSKNMYIINKHGNFEKDKNSWKNGKRHGEWQVWQQYSPEEKDCILGSKEIYVEGELINKLTFHHEYYNNGQKRSKGTYKDGEFVGKWTWWYENGQKWCEGTYKDGKQDGLWTNWHDQTEKSQEGTFKDGKREGIWTFWYKHGQKKKEGPYRDGKEDGLWTGWHENGQKSSEKTFKNGESISEECWDEDENVTDQSNFNNKADEKNKMIITEETEVESSPDYKIVNIIGTFDGEEFILSRIHSHPVEGQDDLWERTDIEVKKNESSEDDNVLVDRYFAADFDYK